MLTASVERYICLRQSLGVRFLEVSRLLRAYATFATDRGDTHVQVSAAIAWATAASTPGTRYVRLQAVVHLARFLHAEDPRHEVPPSHLFPAPKGRLLPYIYSPNEIAQLIAAARRLARTYPIRRETYATIFGLVGATGMRISEALNLRIDDLRPDGVLMIRKAKGGKSRLIPLHQTVLEALDRYLTLRCNLPVSSDLLFLSRKARKIARSTVNQTFRRIVLLAGLPHRGTRPCRIHDLRHTFATRSLERCPTDRESVARHFVALATYLGHADITHTYWYLEATPELMTHIADAAEALICKEGA